MHSLLHAPSDYAHVVVAVAENVIASGKAMLGAIFFHFVQLLHLELVVANNTPIMRC